MCNGANAHILTTTTGVSSQLECSPGSKNVELSCSQLASLIVQKCMKRKQHEADIVIELGSNRERERRYRHFHKGATAGTPSKLASQGFRYVFQHPSTLWDLSHGSRLLSKC